MNTVVERIQTFNQGRDPRQIHSKYQLMRQNVFAFFRGTCHLFYQDWPANSSLDEAPSAWICGDLHLQNLGSYKADNRLVYFNINDFDESALAPCTWDLARFLTCLLVSARTLKITKAQALKLCKYFLQVYTCTLVKGHVRTVEEDKAVGLARDLLFQVKKHPRQALLDKLCELAGDVRKLHIDGKHFDPITEIQRAQVTTAMQNWGTKQLDPQFFKVLDVAHRIAGIGSLGLERYAVLVEGKGSLHHNYVLDLKEERSSALQSYLKLPQPHWASEAERVVSIQRWVQMMPPALLTAVELEGKFYALRELQPQENKVNLQLLGGKLKRLEQLVETIAQVLAWDQLHSAGRHGSATAYELIEFAQAARWRTALLKYAHAYAAQVDKDYLLFCSAFDSGVLSAEPSKENYATL